MLVHFAPGFLVAEVCSIGAYKQTNLINWLAHYFTIKINTLPFYIHKRYSQGHWNVIHPIGSVNKGDTNDAVKGMTKMAEFNCNHAYLAARTL